MYPFSYTGLRLVHDEKVRNAMDQVSLDAELTRNSQSGDYHILERLLESQMDPDEYHALALGVRHFVEAHPSQEAELGLLTLYENGLCSLCRRKVVKELITINRFPDWMRNECQYDAYSETRELVKAPV